MGHICIDICIYASDSQEKHIPCVKPFRVSRDSEIPISRVKHSGWPSAPFEKGIQAGNPAWDHPRNHRCKGALEEFTGNSPGIHFGQLSYFPHTPPLPLHTTHDQQGWRFQMYNAKLLSSSQTVYVHIYFGHVWAYILCKFLREKSKEKGRSSKTEKEGFVSWNQRSGTLIILVKRDECSQKVIKRPGSMFGSLLSEAGTLVHGNTSCAQSIQRQVIRV